MNFDLPLYAVQRCGRRWLIWAPSADPCAPAVHAVAVLVGRIIQAVKKTEVLQ
jgi:hypothetical protein